MKKTIVNVMNYKKSIFPVLVLLSGLFATACLDTGDSFDVAEQFGKDSVKIDSYLANKGITAQIDTATRMRYLITDEGTGDNPKVTNKVVVNYVGKIIPSETTFGQDDTVSLSLQTLIPGWQIGLPKIKEGGSISLFIPSYYAYGHSGKGDIPADACIRFDIDLIEVK